MSGGRRQVGRGPEETRRKLQVLSWWGHQDALNFPKMRCDTVYAVRSAGGSQGPRQRPRFSPGAWHVRDPRLQEEWVVSRNHVFAHTV